MKKITAEQYAQTRAWVYRNARAVELAQWQYLFEGGDARRVTEALAAYQNADGGFGWALEADNWNPESTPITTAHAYKILCAVGLDKRDEPMIQDIVRYFEESAPFLGYGFPFTLPGNDNHPHAPWWTYSEKQNQDEYIGVTTDAITIALRFARPGSKLLERAQSLLPGILDSLMADTSFGDMGLESMRALLALERFDDSPQYLARLCERTNAHMARDPATWTSYSPMPSNYIDSKASPFYAGNEALIEQELDFMIDTLPANNVWPIPWSWFNLNERYASAFAVSETWWKAARAVIMFGKFKAFGRLPD